MKSFANVLKVVSVVVLLSSCAYENDPGLLPKGKTDSIDGLLGKPDGEVLSTKYESLSAVCVLKVKAAHIDSQSEESSDILAAITEGSPAAGPMGSLPPEQQPNGDILTHANEKLTINFAAQLIKERALKEIKDGAVMTLLIPNSTGTSDTSSVSGTGTVSGTVTVTLNVAPLKFKEDETKVDKNSIVVSKHSPRMEASALFSAQDLTGNAVSETKTISLSEGINASVDSDKTGTTVSCDFAATLKPDETFKNQLLIVDCATDEKELKDDKVRLDILKQNCDGKGHPKKAPPPATQPETK